MGSGGIISRRVGAGVILGVSGTDPAGGDRNPSTHSRNISSFTFGAFRLNTVKTIGPFGSGPSMNVSLPTYSQPSPDFATKSSRNACTVSGRCVVK